MSEFYLMIENANTNSHQLLTFICFYDRNGNRLLLMTVITRKIIKNYTFRSLKKKSIVTTKKSRNEKP